MTESELLNELERQFEEQGTVPFSLEEGTLIAKLSFTMRSLTIATLRDGLDCLSSRNWPRYVGVAGTFRHCTLVPGPRDASSRSGCF